MIAESDKEDEEVNDPGVKVCASDGILSNSIDSSGVQELMAFNWCILCFGSGINQFNRISAVMRMDKCSDQNGWMHKKCDVTGW